MYDVPRCGGAPVSRRLPAWMIGEPIDHGASGGWHSALDIVKLSSHFVHLLSAAQAGLQRRGSCAATAHALDRRCLTSWISFSTTAPEWQGGSCSPAYTNDGARDLTQIAIPLFPVTWNRTVPDPAKAAMAIPLGMGSFVHFQEPLQIEPNPPMRNFVLSSARGPRVEGRAEGEGHAPHPAASPLGMGSFVHLARLETAAPHFRRNRRRSSLRPCRPPAPSVTTSPPIIRGNHA
jgi:hypothetical protein